MPQQSISSFYSPTVLAGRLGKAVRQTLRNEDVVSSNLQANEDSQVERKHNLAAKTPSGYTKALPISKIGADGREMRSYLLQCTTMDTQAIYLQPMAKDYIPAIKRLTSNLLPVKYPDAFFSDPCSDEDPTSRTFTRVAVTQDTNTPIGWIRCRVEPFPSPENHITNAIYVQALCLLGPFRGRGIAAEIMDYLLRLTEATEVLERFGCISHIYAHVWERNTDALDWYAKRGFRQILFQNEYYRRLRPGGAWIVRRDINWHHET